MRKQFITCSKGSSFGYGILKQGQIRKEPNIFTVIAHSVYMRSHVLAEICSEGADIVIKPSLAHIGPGEFHRAQECILQGEFAAQESIPDIKRQLGLGSGA